MQKRFLTLVTLALVLPAATTRVEYRADQKPGTAEQIERGRQMFGACSGCHGPDGTGVVGMAPRINSGPYLAIVSNDFLERAILEGRSGTNMIAWGQALPPTDVEAIVAYLRSWQTEDGVELDESPLRGSPKKGAKLFAANCERCHGPSGKGYTEDGMGIGIGNADFLASASDGMIRAILERGKVGTPMQSFTNGGSAQSGPLDAKEIDAIIAFLRDSADHAP